MISCVIVFDGRATRVVYGDIDRSCSDPAWNLVRPRSWCRKIHFETKKQSPEMGRFIFRTFQC